MACVLSWTGNWSPEQRQKFLTTVAQLEAGPGEEDLLFGMSGLGLHQGELSSLYFVLFSHFIVYIQH